MSDLYKNSGVNIDKGNEVVAKIKEHVKSTHSDAVLANIGSFGGLFDLSEIVKNYREPVLVQSIDGVGTKLSIAKMVGRYDSVGEDIVGHSCGDIVAMGAKPLTFLDYVANEHLEVEVMEEILKGMSKACREAGVSIIGGETAEMPGTYAKGEHDIAGCITGIVEKSKIITGEKIRAGDVMIGLASSGLHTNGYSLARKVIFDGGGHKADDLAPELGGKIGDALLATHTNYAPAILKLLESVDVHGIAHITGGGFVDNIPRILPANLDASIKLGTWPVLPIFSFIQKMGKIEDKEMYKVFNMGIGMVVVVDSANKEKAMSLLKDHNNFLIGEIVSGNQKVILT